MTEKVKQAKDATARLRDVVRDISRDDARVIHSEVTQIAKTLEKRHKFKYRAVEVVK